MAKPKQRKSKAHQKVEGNPASFTNHRFAPILFLAITALIYFPSLHNQFVNLDDPQYVLENPVVKAFSFENLQRIFSEQFVGNYQPVTMFSYMIDHALFGLDPFGWHFSSLILYLLCTLLVFLILELLAKDRNIAFWGSLVYALHPLHVESVSWISERKDVLYGFFFLAGVYLYIKPKAKKNTTNPLASPLAGARGVMVLVLFALSLLSKAQAVVFPLALFAIDYLQKRPFKKSLIIEKLPLFALAFAFGLVAISVQGEAGALQTYQYFPFYERLLFSSYALMTYLHKMLLPLDLSCFYPYPETNDKINTVWVYLSPLVLLSLAALVWKFFNKERVMIFGLTFFLLLIGPVLQLLPVGDALYADRYTFLPSMGLIFIAVHFAFTKLNRRLFVAVAGAYIALIGFLTYKQTTVWKDSIALYTSAIDNGYQAAIIYNNRGKAYSDSGDYVSAIKDFESLVALKPKYPNAWRNKGLVHQHLEEYEEAIASFDQGLTYYPEDVIILLNRGAVYIKLNDFKSAINDYTRIIELQPDNGEGYYARSEAYGKNNQLDLALADINKAIELVPENAQAYNNRGIIYAMSGKHAEALENFSRSLELNPENYSAYTNRSLANRALGNNTAALKDLMMAKENGVTVDDNLINELKSITSQHNK